MTAAARYIVDLAARGRHYFTTEEAAAALGSSSPTVRAALRRLKAKGEIVDPFRGFYVIVPPEDFVTEWRDRAPWVLDRQVEQDLVISRALVELFSREPIANALAFRGGTALYKLHIAPAARYSGDIDLVQTRPGGIGEVLDAIHDALDPWLDKPRWKQTEGRVTLN